MLVAAIGAGIRSVRWRAGVGLGLVMTAAFWAPTLAASPKGPRVSEKVVCVDAHAWGQHLRNHDRLIESVQSFKTCARDVCPAVVRKECTRWRSELEGRIPTLVLSVTSPEGDSVRPTEIQVDGKSVEASGEVGAILVDPGEHTLTVVHAGRTVEKKVTVQVGERNREVRVVVGSPVTASAGEGEGGPIEGGEKSPGQEDEKAASWRRPVGWGLAVTGALGLTSALYFGIRAKGDENELLDTCAPRCSQQDVDSMRTLYRVSDLSLGIGVIAGGVGTWLLLGEDGSEAKQEATQDERGEATEHWVGVAPTLGGASLLAGGRF